MCCLSVAVTSLSGCVWGFALLHSSVQLVGVLLPVNLQQKLTAPGGTDVALSHSCGTGWCLKDLKVT